MTGKIPRVALVWAQFAPYHVDRCERVQAHLLDRADLLAVEVATGSKVYAWEPSGAIEGVRKVTLFPGRTYETISRLARFLALFRVLRSCKHVFFGIGYNEPEIIVLSFLLRLFRVHVVMMTDSKFDDGPRHLPLEVFKSLLVSGMQGALVAGFRQRDYVRFLGFRRRSILLGYDCVDVERVRAQAGGTVLDSDIAHDQRPFLFVGRFVAKKNLFRLLDGYGAYVRRAGGAVRRLVLVGSGELEVPLRDYARALGIDGLIDWPGFLSAPEVAGMMRGAAALFLLSTVEQWGLVVNEAVAVGLPVVVSPAVGAADLLVRNLLNGFVISGDCIEAICAAMMALTQDADAWRAMAAHSIELSSSGDVTGFAESVAIFVKLM